MEKKISTVNRFVTEGNIRQLIEEAEALHVAQFDMLLPQLVQGNIRPQVVCVAGPSSSGKTIFTNRLKHLLAQRGVPSLVLSMDNYFHNKEHLKTDDAGNYDFEAVDVVNVTLFRQQLSALLEGQEVCLPHYCFYTGKKEYDQTTTHLPSDSIVLVEGIHALNYDAVFGSNWEKGHFGIYIAPRDSYAAENGTVIEPHQVRLVRRMVRDANYRNCNMMGTLSMWDSVRSGEQKWILPYAKNAAFRFNASLAYELCVLKPFFMAQYAALQPEEQRKVDAYLDKKILEAFAALPAQAVPQVSILNEFIPRTS